MKKNELVQKILGTGKKKTMVSTLLMTLVMIVTTIVATSVAPVAAAPGDIAGNVSFGQQCTSGVGVGITYDGANLWYSCDGSTPDLIRADPKTGAVSANYTMEGGLGSLAYDAGRNVIWAAVGGGSGISGEIYKIQLDASKNVVGAAIPVFNTGVPSGLVDGLGFDATVTPNQLYYSPDGSTTVYVFDVNGNPIRSFPWSGSSCYNSGVAIGGDLLFQGSDGCSHVWVVNKTTLAPAFDFPTNVVASDPNFRDESLTCDPNTFSPVDVMWSKEAYAPMRAHAFEIPKGTCGFGGQASTPKGNITGMKFNDTNHNGAKDSGESGLANWTITLTNESGGVVTNITDASGNYSFTDLADGNYTVGENIQPGWVQTAPAVSLTGSATYKVEIKGGNQVTDKDFGNFFDIPSASCIKGPNPSGNIPPAKGGQRPDGFYQLLATDIFDPSPQIFVKDMGSGTVFPFSPPGFANGTNIKYTQAPGATPSIEPFSGVVAWHITGKGDAAVYAVNSVGNPSPSVSCLVPPPPK